MEATTTMNDAHLAYGEMELITTWVVEDKPEFRSAIAGLLNQNPGIRCEHALGSCEEALELLVEHDAPEVILMDIGLPGMNGIDGVREIKAISPGTEIIILTIHEDDEKVFDALRAGASGYLLKHSPEDSITSAVREVTNGGRPMNAQIARKVFQYFSRPAQPETDYRLTKREKQTLNLLMEGLTKKQIAEKLFVTYNTIDTHVRNIYTKLQVHSLSGAMAKIIKHRTP